jgi:hypothetical protein
MAQDPRSNPMEFLEVTNTILLFGEANGAVGYSARSFY